MNHGRPLKIGINGFGRIGRAIFRRLLQLNHIEAVIVNDTEKDLANLAYLLRFDSVYGRLPESVIVRELTLSVGGRQEVFFYSNNRIEDVPWENFQVDVVIEATGVESNILGSHRLIEQNRVKKVIVTNAHHSVDQTIVMSVNESSYMPQLHNVVSSSICDANAIAPVLYHLDAFAGIEHATVTTLHPWLSYQNLLDGPVSSVSNPGHNWQEYSLGRSSVGNLILKNTTAAEATLKVLPQLRGRLEAISFRVPTSNVSASDFSIVLSRATSIDEIQQHLKEISKAHGGVIALNSESLVSGDFSGMNQSCVIDLTKMSLAQGKYLKLISWYDNEWAYSCRVLDVAELIA
jgi:glyceraldehyde 3-phosphate dehydrogenase